MHAVEKRRREWLLGRWVSKQAAQSLLGRDAAPPPALAKIEIVPDPYGRPTVSLPPQFRPPALSIAHSQGTAVALAVLDPDTLVGVDLESLESPPPGLRIRGLRSPGARPADRSVAGFAPAVGLAYVVRQGSRGQSAGAWFERWTDGIPCHPRRHPYGRRRSGIAGRRARPATAICRQILHRLHGDGIRFCVFCDDLSTGSSPHEAKPAGDPGLPAAKNGRVDRGLGLHRSRPSATRCCSPSWVSNRSMPWFCVPPSRNTIKPRCLSRNCWPRSASNNAICRSTNLADFVNTHLGAHGHRRTTGRVQ